jgi:hypothetical protein
MSMLLVAAAAMMTAPVAPAAAVPAAAPFASAAIYAVDAPQNGRGKGNKNGWKKGRDYDWNRVPPGHRYYYPDDYYRDGRYYRERRLSRYDRIYRGRNGRYYCRRSDGTTGLLIGGAAGALLGNTLSNGRSATLATLLGAAAGAALGASIDRGEIRCR